MLSLAMFFKKKSTISCYKSNGLVTKWIDEDIAHVTGETFLLPNLPIPLSDLALVTKPQFPNILHRFFSSNTKQSKTQTIPELRGVSEKASTPNKQQGLNVISEVPRTVALTWCRTSPCSSFASAGE
jgi:hypothetical protein